MNDLKPCPFCGYDDPCFTRTEDGDWVVWCPQGDGCRSMGTSGARRQAKEFWNTRPRELTEEDLDVISKLLAWLMSPVGVTEPYPPSQIANVLRAILARYGRA